MGKFSNYYATDSEDKPKKAKDPSEYYQGADGECDFEILSVTEGKSSAGNTQLTLFLRVTDKNGKSGKCMDWLPDLPQMAWKTASVLASIGKESLNRPSGFDPEDIVGGKGRGILKTGKWRRSDGVMITSSKVDKYLGNSKGKAYKTPVVEQDDGADELPF